MAVDIKLGLVNGISGYSGYSGTGGYSGYSGYSGAQGLSGYSGAAATNHAGLSNLSYSTAGHTGFQKELLWDVDYTTYLIDH
jgi:hypothetical protein